MKKLCYYMEPTMEMAAAMRRIADMPFLSHISYEATTDGFFEVEIVCGEENVCAIQDILAPII